MAVTQQHSFSKTAWWQKHVLKFLNSDVVSALPCWMQMAALKSHSHAEDNGVKLALGTAKGEKVH